MVVDITNRTGLRINRSLIERAIKTVLSFGRAKGMVSVVIVGDAEMKKLNYKYRHKNKVTDILSFREQDSKFPEPGFAGELIVDFLQIKRQAKLFNQTIAHELAYIIIHGTLHLLGYKDETETGRLKMEELGDKLIKKIAL